ncbi:hypothetical protein PsorP6_015925 [Peronosclerospora sorghi]|uniref:Uncharacterized protein n=2 Tax=Peronosclerospora sorghi TaxID=230839 RepID=A0ACC0WQD3_9STRA|nr:hypothetical protein PsorP6_015934 [Peronosclerospora sorghi]KAI9920255.1 hypothetical protein PsorP6_015925 [Peronosclerospora sorghi]
MEFPDQLGTMAFIPQLVDAIKLPVIAAGGIGDARGVSSANVLGAAAVQMGTVFLLADETRTSPLHRNLLKQAARNGIETRITNVFTRRPARGFVTRIVHERGPMCAAVPEFPLAGVALKPLQQAAEASADYVLLFVLAPALAREASAEMIVRSISQHVEASSTVD